MSNLLAVLPDFDLAPYSHIIPSIERACVAVVDLLTLDAVHVAKRAQVPPGEVKKLTDALISALHRDASASASAPHASTTAPTTTIGTNPISTLDDGLDAALAGGLFPGHLIEVVGESAAGKTQFLLTLLLASQLQSTDDGGPSDAAPGSALYISTEAPLQTTRLAQILKQHPKLAALPPERRPSLGRIHSTHVHDVVAQDHILHFQVPVAIAKHNINLVIVDSIAANYRAEFDKGGGPGARSQRGAETLAQRSQEIAQTAKSLRDIARKHNITVVVANQVADRFAPIEPSSQQQQQVMRTSSQRSLGRATTTTTTTTTTTDPPPAPAAAPPQLSTADPLSLEHQQRFFTGWGDDPSSTDLKTPSLGLALTNQLSTRIALLKSPVYKDRAYRAGEDKELDRWDRSCRVVFSAWGAEGRVPFEIWEGGVRSLPSSSSVGEGGGGGGEAGR